MSDADEGATEDAGVRRRDPVDPTEVNRELLRDDAEIVTTHVHHVVDEVHDRDDEGDAVSTVCDYYLNADQYGIRRDYGESVVSVTGLCHHCVDALRTQLAREAIAAGAGGDR